MRSLPLARCGFLLARIRRTLADAVCRWHMNRLIDANLPAEDRGRPVPEQMRRHVGVMNEAFDNARNWNRNCLFLAEAALARTTDLDSFIHEYRHDFLPELMQLAPEKRLPALQIACLYF